MREKEGRDGEKEKEIAKKSSIFTEWEKFYPNYLFSSNIDLDGNWALGFGFFFASFALSLRMAFGQHKSYYLYIWNSWNSSTIVAFAFVYSPKNIYRPVLRFAKNCLMWKARKIKGKREGEKKKEITTIIIVVVVVVVTQHWSPKLYRWMELRCFRCSRFVTLCLLSRWTISFF